VTETRDAKKEAENFFKKFILVVLGSFSILLTLPCNSIAKTMYKYIENTDKVVS
jgi:hypothetical protein